MKNVFKSIGRWPSEIWAKLFRKRQPSFTSIRWRSSRWIRQTYFIDLMKADEKFCDDAKANIFDQKRTEAEKQFWKLGIIQITLTGFLGLALMKSNASFSIFGISSTDAYKLRDFLLFCHALLVSMAVVLQQHQHKLEDYLAAVVRSRSKSEEQSAALFLQYLGPVETFNITVLPFGRHLLQNAVTRSLFKVHSLTRLFSALGFAAFTLSVPLLVAITIFKDPPNGWTSYALACYWVGVMGFSTISQAIHVFGVPYTDYSYAMKLDALQKDDPHRHDQVMKEIVRTGKLVDLD